jgi:predicted amino acid-binding ACT domain protein
MKKELLFITVIGQDKKGIVASISTLLFKQSINIEDISQKVIEGYFVMNMLVDVASSSVPMEKTRKDLEKLGEKLGLSIQLHHENIFKAMHRV